MAVGQRGSMHTDLNSTRPKRKSFSLAPDRTPETSHLSACGSAVLRHYLPQDVMMTVVQGLVMSRVRYCLTVYGNGSAANHARLMKVVNFAARVVAGLRKFDHVSHVRDHLGLRTPRQMCDSRTAVVAHSVRALREPEELANLFCTFADARVGDRATRQDRYLRPPSTRTAAGQRSFAYRATSLLNAVPDDVMRPGVKKVTDMVDIIGDQ